MRATLRRNNREYRGLTYLHRPTHDRTELRYQGREFNKVYESLDTEKAYQRGLEEKREPGQSVVWSGQKRAKGGRYYGVWVRSHKRRSR